MNAFISNCFEKGYNVEKYGLLGKMGGEQEKWVEKEVIREKRVEIPVEVIKEVEKIVEVIKEVPVDRIVEKVVIKEVTKEIPVEKVIIKEVIKEVPVEKVITKIEYVSDDTQLNELLLKIQQLESERQEFSTKLTETENIFQNEMSKKEQELNELRQELDKPPVEKIVEVIVEKPIVDEKQKLLQQTLQNLRGQLNLKDEEIKKLKEDIEYLKGEIDKPATFLRTSNLKDNLY
jgi:hypothetical protein